MVVACFEPSSLNRARLTGLCPLRLPSNLSAWGLGRQRLWIMQTLRLRCSPDRSSERLEGASDWRDARGPRRSQPVPVPLPGRQKDMQVTSNLQTRRERVVVVGSGSLFASGISHYTYQLTSALAEEYDVGALLMRRLVPRRLYPGRDHVGAAVANAV